MRLDYISQMARVLGESLIIKKSMFNFLLLNALLRYVEAYITFYKNLFFETNNLFIPKIYKN